MPRRSFVDTIRDIKGGEVIEQLDASLQHLVQQIQRTVKGGSLKLTLDIRPMKGSTEAVVLKSTITVKEPQFDDNGTVLFPTPEGNLTRSFHKQDELPGLSAVPSAPATAATAAAAAAVPAPPAAA